MNGKISIHSLLIHAYNPGRMDLSGVILNKEIEYQ